MAFDINRRTFLGSAVATGVVSVVPRHVLGGAGYVAPSEKITLAQVGMGTQGFNELGGLLADPQIQIVAVCDPNTDSNDYVECGKNSIRNRIRTYLGDPNWLENARAEAGGREVGRLVVDTYYKKQRGAENFQRPARLCRFPRRIAGQGEGRRRRQGHDARPPSRHRLYRGDAEGQACHVAQAAGQPGSPGAGWWSIRHARPRWPRTCWPSAAARPTAWSASGSSRA